MKRQPEGVPAGGQFAADRKIEPASSLKGAYREYSDEQEAEAALASLRHLIATPDRFESHRQQLADRWALEKAEGSFSIREVAQMWKDSDPGKNFLEKANARGFAVRVQEAYDERQFARYRDATEPPSRGSMSSNRHVEELSYYWEEKGLLEPDVSLRGVLSNRRVRTGPVLVGHSSDGIPVTVSMGLQRVPGDTDQWRATSVAHAGAEEVAGLGGLDTSSENRIVSEIERVRLAKAWEVNNSTKADSEDVARALLVMAKAKAARKP